MSIVIVSDEFERPDGDAEVPFEGWPPWADEHWEVGTTPALTGRQAEIIHQVARLTREMGYPPTLRELMKAVDIRSPNGILCHLKVLRRKGWLEWEPNLSRSIRIARDVVIRRRVRRLVRRLEGDGRQTPLSLLGGAE